MSSGRSYCYFDGRETIKVNSMTSQAAKPGAECARQHSTVLLRSVATVHFTRDYDKLSDSAMNAVDGSDHYSKTSDGS